MQPILQTRAALELISQAAPLKLKQWAGNRRPFYHRSLATFPMVRITSKTTKAELLTIVSTLQSETETIKAERTIALGLATLAAIFWLLF